jgi:sn-glycerol 3-phosphate transport system ATP-binding protein
MKAGRAITVGVRPEHLQPCNGSPALVSGSVEMVEQLGADTLIHIGHGKDPVVARLGHGVQPEIGATFSVTADPGRIFLFDAATGARIH